MSMKNKFDNGRTRGKPPTLTELAMKTSNAKRERLIKRNLKRILKFFRNFENG